jgi:hypothetical protein
VALHVQVDDAVSIDTEVGILLGADVPDGPVEVLLRPGVHTADQILVFERDGRKMMLFPSAVNERGADYERVSCRQHVRQAG